MTRKFTAMRINTIYLLMVSLLLTAGTGCKKWLDVNPKTEIREGILLQDEIGFKDAITGVYQLLGSGSLYGQQMTMGFMDAIAQRYSVSSSSHVFYQAARFNYEDAKTKAYIDNFWTGMYEAIANTNNVIGQIDDVQPVFSGNNYNQIKGEALALRVFLHFDLLRMFGPSPAVDMETPAIPYVTSFDVSVSPLLSSAAVMDSCLKDLAEAGQLLSIDKSIKERYPQEPFLSFTRNHFNYWAVKDLEARILLYRGDKTGAFAAAKVVIDNQPEYFPFVSLAAASADDNPDRLYAREHLFSLYDYKLKQHTEAYTKSGAVNGIPILVHSTGNIKSLYETADGGSSDIRFVYLFEPAGNSFASKKYWQDKISSNSGFDYLRNLIPIIRLSEIYYISAECAPSTEEGVAFLNAVRANRGLADLNTTISAANLQTEILKEYKKETYAEGQLFFYFKRKNAAKVDGSSLTPKYAFPLPDNEVEFGNR